MRRSSSPLRRGFVRTPIKPPACVVAFGCCLRAALLCGCWHERRCSVRSRLAALRLLRCFRAVSGSASGQGSWIQGDVGCYIEHAIDFLQVSDLNAGAADYAVAISCVSLPSCWYLTKTRFVVKLNQHGRKGRCCRGRIYAISYLLLPFCIPPLLLLQAYAVPLLPAAAAPGACHYMPSGQTPSTASYILSMQELVCFCLWRFFCCFGNLVVVRGWRRAGTVLDADGATLPLPSSCGWFCAGRGTCHYRTV